VAAQPDQNPSTYPEGTGWKIGNQFIPFLGTVDLSNLTQGNPLNGVGVYRIVYGTLTGYGLADEAAHGHQLRGGAGSTQLDDHHQHREATLPGDASEATIVPLSDNTGADPSRRGPGMMFHQRNEAPRQAEAARLRAVDAVLSSWRPGGLLRARLPFDGERPSGSSPTLSLSLRDEGDLITHAWPVKSLGKAFP
jgi:hypothetical protein